MRGRRIPKWRTVTLVVFASIGFFYSALAGGIFFWLRFQREISGVELIDVALPSHWPQLRQNLGRHAIGQGLSQMQAGRARESSAYLAAGLKRYPGHREGRLALAELRAASGSSAAAIELILAGTSFHASDPDYVFSALRQLRRLGDEQAIISFSWAIVVKAACPEISFRAEVAGGLAVIAAADALRELARYDMATTFLQSFPTVAESVEGRLLRTRIAWDRGDTTLALMLLREWTRASDYAPILTQELISRLRQSGFRAEARRHSVAFRLAHPKAPSARFILMAAHLEGGERARLQMEIESLLIDFSNDRTTLLQAAEFAAHHGLVEFVEAIQARLQHRSDSASSVDLLRCEALLVSGRYAEALACTTTN